MYAASQGLRLVHKSRVRYYSVIDASRDVLCSLHDITGTSWSLVIPLATAIVSAGTLPLAIKSRRQQQRLVELQPLVDAEAPAIARQVRREEPELGVAAFERETNKRVALYRRELRARHGVGVLRALALPLAKLPIWLTLSFTLRSMAGAPVFGLGGDQVEAGFASEGFAHIPDLTATDPLIALPVCIGILNLVNIEVGAAGRKSTSTRLTSVIENTMRVVSVGMIYIAAQMPAAVCLYWASSASLSVIQNFLLDRRKRKTDSSTTTSTTTPRPRMELPE
ncbi:Cytochrome c oxidase assembly protein cox18, mitochondrial [Savitreella phatthalungensis]